MNNGQSAGKLLSATAYEEPSTTIPWEGSTILKRLEKAHIKFYNLCEKLPSSKGIYFIYCNNNDKMYIGSCVNFHARIIRHRYHLKHNIHHSKKLQNSFNKHGVNSFKIGILELVENDLKIAEEKWIKIFDSFNNGFNCTDNCIVYKKYKLTSEQIEKRSEKSRKKIVCLNLKGEYICTYTSVTDAAKAIKDQTTNISSCCKGKLHYIKNCIFVYQKDYDKNKDYSYKGKTYIFSDEHKLNISKALQNKVIIKSKKQIEDLIKRSSKKVIQENIITKQVQKYNSLKECCQQNKLYVKTLKKHIMLKTPLEGFLYKFNEDIV